MPRRADPKLIYDVGVYDGADTRYYLKQGYRVVAVEADPQLVDQARRIFAREIDDGQLTLVHAGIAAERGTATFWICPEKS